MNNSIILRSTTDPHSSSRPEEARVIHTHLELNVDFNQKVLTGNAILTIKKKPFINEITLDILVLEILSVTNVFDRTPLNYKVIFNYFGSSLRIYLPQAVDGASHFDYQIQIEYKTTRYSPALLWLTPEQTADQTHPFLLSNNKLIYARTWFPCQDTPSVKFTYTAKISVQKHFRVLMSAILEKVWEGPDLDVYEFRQEIPVPSYTVVVAVGSLSKSKNLSEKVFMYAERHTHFANTFPFATIVHVLNSAEMLCGRNFWDRHVICVLPPSIAHFEIECPCVTFISPTIIGADSFHVSKYIARSISQSWAGTLVTCVNWNHLWLNKSFSTFISRKIICQISNFNNINNFLQKEGLRNLNLMIQNPRNVGLIRCLVPDLTNWSPHLATKYVPYERGCMLLDHLENISGGPLVFKQFLQSYFDHFARQSINTKNLMDYLSVYFSNKIEVSCRVESWFFSIPSINDIYHPDWGRSSRSSLEEKCFKLAKTWVEWNCDARSVPSTSKDRMSPCDVQEIIFLNYLNSFYIYLTEKKLEYIENCFFRRTSMNNAEIRFLWLLLCIKVRWSAKITPALNFAIQYCSPNYACPIFQHLYEWGGEVRQNIIVTYNANRNKMLDKTQKELDRILHLTPYI